MPHSAATCWRGAFVVFLLPWTGVFLWASAVRPISTSSPTRVRVRGWAPIADRTYHGELDDLARSIEELRATIAGGACAAPREHRAAMDEIVCALGEGLLAVSPRGGSAFANRRLAEMFGGEPGDGRPVGPGGRAQAVRRGGASNKALHGETSTERVTYDDRKIEVRAFPAVASPDIAAVALFIDVTRIERLQQRAEGVPRRLLARGAHAAGGTQVGRRDTRARRPDPRARAATASRHAAADRAHRAPGERPLGAEPDRDPASSSCSAAR